MTILAASADAKVLRKLNELTGTALLFHGLADPTRLIILQHLATGEHRVRDLTEHLGLAQSTVSAHLACLRDCGLVTSRAVGRASHYALAAEPQLQQLLAAAHTLRAQTNEHPVEHSADHRTDGTPENGDDQR